MQILTRSGASARTVTRSAAVAAALPDGRFPRRRRSLAPGVCVKDRWRELLRVTQPHSDDHVTLFNDLHFLMASLGAEDGDTSRRLLEGLQELAK